jgi:hypothetical protein
VEADDDGYYVMKFRGAGQGLRALVAEVVAGELARSLGLLVPELVIAELDPELARAEPDIEIQELAEASVGDNLGVDFLPGALPFTPAAGRGLDPALAAGLVWFDALVMNVDRTPRNPNLLMWHDRTWLIDHGAAFYRQHAEAPLAASARAPFPPIRQHVALPLAAPIAAADERLAGAAERAIDEAVARVPDEWSASARQSAAPTSEPFCAPGWRRRGSLSRRLSVPERKAFQYTILRVVPRIERGECINVGVILFCPQRRFLGARIELDDARLRALDPDLDPASVQPHLDAIAAVVAGDRAAGTLAQLSLSERFGWVAAPSSTVIQPSDVHTGLSEDPAATLRHLFGSLVPVREGLA